MLESETRIARPRVRIYTCALLALGIAVTTIAVQPQGIAEAEAATPRIGRYVVQYWTHRPKPSPDGVTAYRGEQSVTVLAYKPKAKKVKLRFYFDTCYYGSNFHSWDTWAKVRKGTASFTFRYYYGRDKTPPKEGLGKAHATVKFGKGHVKVKHKALFLAGARFGFDTNGKFLKIKRGVHRKYIG